MVTLVLERNQLTALSDSIGHLTRLSKLDLESNQLKSLPENIGDLTQLTQLKLDGNLLTALPVSIGNLYQLADLDISSNKLSTVPTSIAKLTQLTTLNLYGNAIISLPDTIGQLFQLTELILGQNKLTTLPDNVTQLIQLTRLGLSYNKFTTLPDGITQLSQLTNLDLSGNQLTTLPDNIAGLSQLTTLFLAGNQLTTLPASIAQLSKLDFLYLRNNNITSLPKSINQLSKLTSLNLGDNKLNMLPENISQLSQLQSLELDNNQLSKLLRSITNLTQLASLHLSVNQLTELPDNFDQLTKLRALDLGSNQLAAFPECIVQLPQLNQQPRQLNLRFNPFMSFPPSVVLFGPLIQHALECYKIAMLPDDFLTNVKQHEKQYIAQMNKRESDLNPDFTYLRLVNSVNSHTSPSIQRGVDIAGHDQADITYKPGDVPRHSGQYLPHYGAYTATPEPRRILKLNIVGNPCAGKTTLFNQLARQCKPDFAPVPTGAEDRTIGLNVFPDYQFKFNDDTYSVNIWDYGGQRIQYMTHHYLLSSNALFVLVIDADNVEDNTDYWMNIIHQLAKHSPIMIIYNQKIEGDMPDDVNVTPYRVRYGANITWTPCNIKDQHDFAKLLKKLQQLIIEFDYPSLPQKWRAIETALQQISVPYVERDELKVVCQTHGLNDEREQLQFIEHLRRIGSILYYNDTDLKNWVFIRPEWVTRAIYHILTHKSIEDKQGVFSKDWLTTIWKQRKFTEHDINLLEKLLLHRYFEVCYPFDDQQTHFTMPLWLPDVAPEYALSESYHSRYRYQYVFLPFRFISHLIIRFHAFGYLKKAKDTHQMWHWRKGLLLEHKEGEVEIVQTGDDYRDAYITVTYRGSATTVIALQSIVSTEFDSLHRRFDIHYRRNDLDKNPNHVSISIECPHCIATANTTPNPAPITTAKSLPRYHNMAVLIIGTKDNGHNIYQSNFTCSVCQTDIVTEELVFGVNTQNESVDKPNNLDEHRQETQVNTTKIDGDIHVHINQAALVNTGSIRNLNNRYSNSEQTLKNEPTVDSEPTDS